jgi:transposase
MREAAIFLLDWRSSSPAQLVETELMKDATIASRQQRVTQLARRVDWFTRQVIGSGSKRLQHSLQQLKLADVFGAPDTPEPTKEREVPAHRGTAVQHDFDENESSVLLDQARVPVQTIEVPNPDITGIVRGSSPCSCAAPFGCVAAG